MTAKELREKRAQLIKNARATLEKAEAENRDLHADEKKAWDESNTEITNLGTRIERLESLDRLDAQNKELRQIDQDLQRDLRGAIPPLEKPDEAATGIIPANEAPGLAIQGWFYRNSDDDDIREKFTERHRRAQKQTGIGRNARLLNVPLIGRNSNELQSISDYDNFRNALRARLAWDATQGRYVNTSVGSLTTLTGAAGGFLVPEGFSTQFETALLAYGYMQQVADVMRTESAAPLPWPTANDTTNKGRMLTQTAKVDNTGATTAYPTFGAVIFYGYKATSDEVLVPFELIRDNAVGLTTWLGEALGIRIGRVKNDQATTGNGSGNPMGIITKLLLIGLGTAGTNVQGYIKTAKSATLAYDDVISLEHQVDPAYRSNPGVGYMCHDQIIAYLRKLKDGEGRYLWQQSANSGEPDRLNNRPLTRNQSMDSSVASGKNVLLFGDLKKFKIRDVGDVRMYRLVERYRDNDQDAFLAFHEFDSNLVDAGTHPIQLLQVT